MIAAETGRLDGVLVVDKPQGPTSHDVVAVVRRLWHLRKVGHTGTLDPIATGVLPLVLGRATRLAQFLSSSSKAYRAVIRLGVATTTYDALGEPTAPDVWRGSPIAEALRADRGAGGRARRSPAQITAVEVETVLQAFRGTFAQTPPLHSAKHVDGTRAYVHARRLDAVTLPAVDVSTSALDLIELADDRLTLEIACGAGFYVRSLAHDLGVALGCGAHLDALRRTAAGAFTLARAVALSDIAREGPARVVPLRDLLPSIPAVTLDARGVERIRHGLPVSLPASESAGVPSVAPTEPERSPAAPGSGDASLRRLLDDSGELVALGRFEPGAGLLRPFLVLT